MRATSAILFVTALLGSTSAVSAQKADPPLPGTICVGGRQWHPTLEDNQAIESIPVPKSYSSLFESVAPCVRWALDETDLIDWHLEFGSVDSITAALAYLQRDYMRDAPDPASYPDMVRHAYRAASSDMLRVDELSGSEWREFVDESGQIAKLRKTVELNDNYFFLAEQYLRAAEEFGDKRLLAKAQGYLAPLPVVREFLEPRSDDPRLKRDLHNDLKQAVFVDDLRMRAAVLSASLSPSRDHAREARKLLDEFDPPAFELALDRAYSGGDDFCDISEGWNRAEQVEAACKDVDEYPLKVLFYAPSAARLALFDGGGSISWAQYRRVIDLIEKAKGDSCCRRYPRDDLFRLYRAKAAYHLRRFDALGSDGRRDWFQALRALREANSLFPPDEAPARFARIASEWLALWEAGEAIPPHNRNDPRATDDPALRRYAAFLRTVLPEIKQIASGAPQ
jgi:hypothetical protein